MPKHNTKSYPLLHELIPPKSNTGYHPLSKPGASDNLKGFVSYPTVLNIIPSSFIGKDDNCSQLMPRLSLSHEYMNGKCVLSPAE
ncbi:hypothetical protein JTE90_007261 [Oedothorax gibbosus]|uniref:Uncharacterized protein n=1 Tax=Oedothorax gibbosus TaxID=931172 RepID=A0AAV6VLQ6_9ARAC|nr:hypothetical protein JTE90_007261 [Oedothorax gibbosus]